MVCFLVGRERPGCLSPWRWQVVNLRTPGPIPGALHLSYIALVGVGGFEPPVACLMTTPVGPAGCEPAPLIKRAVNCATGPCGRHRNRTDELQTCILPACAGISLFSWMAALAGIEPAHSRFRDERPAGRRQSQVVFSCGVGPAGCEPAPLLAKCAVNCATDP